jgi:hypothetical protein
VSLVESVEARRMCAVLYFETRSFGVELVGLAARAVVQLSLKSAAPVAA